MVPCRVIVSPVIEEHKQPKNGNGNIIRENRSPSESVYANGLEKHL